MKMAFGSLFALAALAAAPLPASAQTATIYGMLGNFDIMNNSGQDAHGFEVEIEGVQAVDVPYTFSVQRYGAAQLVPTPTGVIVRWQSPYDAAGGQFTATTIAHQSGTAFVQGSCYQWNGASYATAGCEHFGVSLYANPTNVTYRWLVADPIAPGQLTAVTLASPVASPVYYVIPPARPALPPVLVAEVPAPEPAESPEQFGNAQWMKTFRTQLNRQVGLDELVSDNPLVPQDVNQIETEWELMQDTPNVEGKQKRNGRLHQGNLNVDTRAVVRRLEIYEYIGAYDPVTHQAICADLTCTAPSAGELGDFVSAQMDAANVAVPSITVTKVGSGGVSSSDKQISCGSACSAFEANGAGVTLTASAASGSVFKGWSGGCSGAQATCLVTVNDHQDVGATFASLFTLSVGRSNKGEVVADTPAADGLLDCGGAGSCSAKFAQGTAVTLTAMAPAGKTFINWTGSGAGACNLSATPTCLVPVTANLSIQANFSK